MGIDMVVRDQGGEKLGELGDPKMILPHLLSRMFEKNERAGPCFLPYIDYYGETIFNHMQAEGLLNEWALLQPFAESADEKEWFKEAESLIRLAIEFDGRVRFSGD